VTSFQKPWEDEHLLATLRTNAELYRALRNGQRLEAENRLFRAQHRPTFIADSPAMRQVVEHHYSGWPSDANVLVTGRAWLRQGSGGADASMRSP